MINAASIFIFESYLLSSISRDPALQSNNRYTVNRAASQQSAGRFVEHGHTLSSVGMEGGPPGEPPMNIQSKCREKFGYFVGGVIFRTRKRNPGLD